MYLLYIILLGCYIRLCTLGCPTKQLSPERVVLKFCLWQGAKESLSDVELENIFVYLILFIPRCSDCKKTLSRIFWNFNTQYFLWIQIIFHILTRPKISTKKIFSGIPNWLRTIKKNLRMRTTYFLVLVFGHRWNVGLMK